MTLPKVVPIGAGPGVYDDLATMVRERTNAAGVMLFIREGDKGDGFSVQFVDVFFLAALPDFLRGMADLIEKQMESHIEEIVDKTSKKGGTS